MYQAILQKCPKSDIETYGRICAHMYTDTDDFIDRPLAPPPQTHTSDRPIFKISFDSENSGKLTRFRIARFLIFAS